MQTTLRTGYTYTGQTFTANAVAGTVIEGRGEVRKGTTYRSPARQSLIENRLDGRVSSYTVLDGSGRRVCKVAPDSIIL